MDKIITKRWFAWYPKKTLNGWVWLQWIMKTTITETRPILRYIFDEKYRKFDERITSKEEAGLLAREIMLRRLQK